MVPTPWLVAAIWGSWLLLTATRGYAPADPADVDQQATARSLQADLMVLVALGGGAGAAALGFAPFTVDPRLAIGLGAVLVALGIVLRQWAARTLGASFTRSVVVRANQPIVYDGPYRVVRHPAYAGDLLAATGLGLTLGNWLSLGIIVVGFVIASVVRVVAEESALEGHPGASYRTYARGRKRLLPGIW